MRIKDLDDIVIFDAFPLAFDPNSKIILTNLLHLENQTLPQKLAMIYTTNKIAKQLLSYCNTKNYKSINRSNIFIIEPYNFIDIIINRRRTLQILFCSSEDPESRNVMVLIRENGKLDYIYAGNFMDIRFALLDDTFASWISNGVEKLYINLKRSDENHIVNDIDQLQKVFNTIEEILNCHQKSKVHIYLPLFGYENFIIKLAYKFPNRIAKQSTLKTFYFQENHSESPAMQYFCNEDVARIFLFLGTTKLQFQAEYKFNNANTITINIKNDRTKCVNKVVDLKNPYYELYYSPEPSPFHLKLMCMLFKPKRLFAIIDEFNIKSKVPPYLKELCVGFKERTQKIQQRKLDKSLGDSTSSQINKLSSTRIVCPTLTKINHNKGIFLSDSESDSD